MNLPRDRAWKFSRKYAYTTLEIGVFRQLLNGLTWDQHQQRDKRVRGSSGSMALDTTVVVGKLEHRLGASFSFILDCTSQPAQGMLEIHLVSLHRMSPPGCTHVSIADYNEVSYLYEVACLKLAVARLSNKHVSRASMEPPAGRARGVQCGGHAGRGAGRWPDIVEESEESGRDGSEETESNIS
ncbi:hypothetical protein JCGZ_03793 [Jatropha curcas]|uniref:Uncharacterized protein n=1 Tax=Jatropha curcas TaxID=180498 RepID=A0A067KXW1_JATCU|nr:hypothetical protein JCGZ_03793 [Jatropha curcas]